MARRKLDRIVVVDVEATCWEGAPPADEVSEIIEVGVCLLDVAAGERVDRESLLVRPAASRVSAFCTGLTGLTQGQVEAGVSFAEACSALRSRFGTRKRVWASYGDHDRRIFEGQCGRTGVAYPFGIGHMNVKTLFAATWGLEREVGMAGALGLLGMPLEGDHHRGGDDAWNIAGILGRVLLAARGGMGSG